MKTRGKILFTVLLSLVTMILSFISGVLICSNLPTYHLITDNIAVKDMSKSDLLAYTYYDDGLDGITLNGKYQDKKALVTIVMNYTEFEMNEIDYPDEKEKVYIVEIYAIATIQIEKNWFDIYHEDVATIITEHY